MKKNRAFSVFLFAALVFSCKSAAPPLDTGGEPRIAIPAVSAEGTGTSVEDSKQAFQQEAPPEDGGKDTVVSQSAADDPGESGRPHVMIPPKVTIEREAAPPEPDLPVLSFLPNPVISGPLLPELPLPDLVIPEEPKPAELAKESVDSVNRGSPPPTQQAPAPKPALPPPQAQPPSQAPQPASPPAPRTPPLPPSFLQPAEPELPSPIRPPVPAPQIPELPARVPPEAVGSQLVFSRIVRATVGQIVEIPFRGTGWVYLGELGNRRGIVYNSRRLDLVSGAVEGQSFVFDAETAGTYVLKFYKQDFIQDYIINDYVQVIVGEAEWNSGTGFSGFPADRHRVVAEPRWPPSDGPTSPQAAAAPSDSTGVTQSPPPAAAAAPATGTAPAAAAATESTTGRAPPAAAGTTRPRQTTTDDSIVPVAPPQAAPEPQRAGPSPADLIPSGAPPAEYVRRAKQEFDAGRVEAALVILDAMRQRFPAGTDEAWWLYGQLLEANSPSRDIRLAHQYYNRLVREYPQSPRAIDAQRRIAYLERYFFNIR